MQGIYVSIQYSNIPTMDTRNEKRSTLPDLHQQTENEEDEIDGGDQELVSHKA